MWYNGCRLKRYNFQIRNKMNKENKTLDKPQNGNDSIADVITRLSKMIDELDSKIQNTDYDTIFNKDCDKDDLRCIKKTLDIFQDLNV